VERQCSYVSRIPEASSAIVVTVTVTCSSCIRFKVFTAVTMKNGVFWVVTPCGSCKDRRFGGTWRLLHQGEKIGELRTTQAATSNRLTFSQRTSVASCRLYCS
jgi:hypothetical protein